MSKIGYSEKARILIANELEVPPDDVDLDAILSCLEREIQNNVSENEIILKPKRGKETKAIHSVSGSVIINKIFNNEHPFEDWLNKLES